MLMTAHYLRSNLRIIVFLFLLDTVRPAPVSFFGRVHRFHVFELIMSLRPFVRISGVLFTPPFFFATSDSSLLRFFPFFDGPKGVTSLHLPLS